MVAFTKRFGVVAFTKSYWVVAFTFTKTKHATIPVGLFLLLVVGSVRWFVLVGGWFRSCPLVFWSLPVVSLVLSVGCGLVRCGFGLSFWWLSSRPLVGLVSFLGGSGLVCWWLWFRPLVGLLSSDGGRSRVDLLGLVSMPGNARLYWPPLVSRG